MKMTKPSKNQSQVKFRAEVKLASTKVYSLEVKLSSSLKSGSEIAKMPDREVSHLPRHPKQQPQHLQGSPKAKKEAELVPKLRTRSNYCRSSKTSEMICAFAMKSTLNKENTLKNLDPKMTLSKRSCARHSLTR